MNKKINLEKFRKLEKKIQINERTVSSLTGSVVAK
jgi:hypothetical protein